MLAAAWRTVVQTNRSASAVTNDKEAASSSGGSTPPPPGTMQRSPLDVSAACFHLDAAVLLLQFAYAHVCRAMTEVQSTIHLWGCWCKCMCTLARAAAALLLCLQLVTCKFTVQGSGGNAAMPHHNFLHPSFSATHHCITGRVIAVCGCSRSRSSSPWEAGAGMQPCGTSTQGV
jgi:hypothetical protein